MEVKPASFDKILSQDNLGESVCTKGVGWISYSATHRKWGKVTYEGSYDDEGK